MKRSIALAVLLFLPLIMGLVDQMSTLAVPVTRTMTYTTTVTTTATEVETTTLYWTYSEFSTVPTTKTTTFATTATIVLPIWRLTTVTGTGTSTRTFWTTTAKLTTKTTTRTITITFPWFTVRITTTYPYTTTVNVMTLRTSTTTSTYTRTTTYLAVLSVVISGTVVTQYPTETLTTILSTSASTVAMAEVETRTLTYTFTIPYVTEEAPPPARPCIIATAAHNSELAPEVRFLRHFRDNIVMSTESGRSFMAMFNRWYYSFSPQAACLVSESPLLRNVVRVSLYPLIGALRAATTVHSIFMFNAEVAAVLAGLVASVFIGLAYVFAPMLLISALGRKRARIRQSLLG